MYDTTIEYVENKPVTYYIYRVKSIIYKLQLEYYYSKLSIEPRFENNFIYFPLHYQPEKTTSPEARHFVHQNLIANLLNYATDDNRVVYIKEHPAQFEWFAFGELGRSSQFYDYLNQLEHVNLIDVDHSHSELLEECDCVATATGTVGWEATLKNKQVLSFGEPWYEIFNNVHSVSSIDDAKLILSKISQSNTILNSNSNSMDIEDFSIQSFAELAEAIINYLDQNI